MYEEWKYKNEEIINFKKERKKERILEQQEKRMKRKWKCKKEEITNF